VLALAVATLPITTGRFADAREERRVAAATRAVAESTLAAERDRLDAAVRARRGAEGDLVLAGRSAKALGTAERSVTADRDRIESRLAGVTAETAAVEEALGGSEAHAAAQREAAGGLQRCIGGVRDATDLLTRRERDRGLRTLQEVVETCKRAETFLAGGRLDSTFAWDFPDPYVLVEGDTFFGYATNSVAGNVQLIRSRDLQRWEWLGEAMPELPVWADPALVWAPSVLKVGDTYLMYFTSRHRRLDLQCIGVAASPKPEGPFTNAPEEPIVCQPDEGGSIDASPYLDPAGTPYLVWKTDGEHLESRRGVAKLWAAPLVADGTRLAFFGTELLRADRPDEQRTIEGPSMVFTQDRWYLFYSVGPWDSADYRTDFALCDGPLGPCRKLPGNTILTTRGDAVAPGGGEVVRAPQDRLLFAYHAWVAPQIGFPNRRVLHLDPITFNPTGWPQIGEPTTG
jgi:hypothetical protein